MPLPLTITLILLLILAPKLLLATYTCHGAELGHGIDPHDCNIVIDKFKQQNARLDPEDQYAFIRRTAFSRQFSQELSLPQAFSYKTCSIGLDIADPAFSMVLVRWRDVSRHLYGLVEHCVGASWYGGSGRGAGGIGEVHGLEFVISNPATGLAVDAALRVCTPRGMSLGRFLLLRAQVNLKKRKKLSALAAARAAA